MSKSLGNVISPHTVIEEFGSDALRMGIIAGRSAGDSAAYSPAKVVAGRNYCNKLWNVARFVEGMLEDKQAVSAQAKPITPADHWMLSKLQQTIDITSSHLDEYRVSEAYETVYHFVWDDFADWYIEASKSELNPDLLLYGLEQVLKLAHPFAPFVTETIWQTLDQTGDSMLASEIWQQAMKFDSKKAAEFEEIRNIVSETRAIVSAMQLEKTALYHAPGVAFLVDHAKLIAKLARIEGVHEVEDGKGLHLTSTSHACWLDVDRERAERYVKKLATDREVAKKRLEGLQNRLSNKNYVKQAPKALVDETKQQLLDTEQLIQNMSAEIDRFNQA